MEYRIWTLRLAWLPLFLLTKHVLANSHLSADSLEDFELSCQDGSAVIGMMMTKDFNFHVFCQNLTINGTIRLDSRLSLPYWTKNQTNFDEVCDSDEFIAGFKKQGEMISAVCVSSPQIEVSPVDKCEIVPDRLVAETIFVAPLSRQNVVLQSLSFKDFDLRARYCEYNQTSRLNGANLGIDGIGRLRRRRQTTYTSTTTPTNEQHPTQAAAAAAAAAAAGGCGANSAAQGPQVAQRFSIGSCSTSGGMTVSSAESDFLFTQMISMYGSSSVTYVEVISATQFVFIMSTQVLQQIIAESSSTVMTMQSMSGQEMTITDTTQLNEWPCGVGSNRCTCQIKKGGGGSVPGRKNTSGEDSNCIPLDARDKGKGSNEQRGKRGRKLQYCTPPVPKQFSIGSCVTSRGMSVSVSEANFLYQQMIEMYGYTSVTYVEVISSTTFVFLMKTKTLNSIIKQSSSSSKKMTMKTVSGQKITIIGTSLLEEWPTQVGTNPCTCNLESGDENSDQENSSGEEDGERSGDGEGGNSGDSDGSMEEETVDSGSGMGEAVINEKWIGIEVIFFKSVFTVSKQEATFVRQSIVELLRIEHYYIRYLQITTSSSFFMICHESVYEKITRLIQKKKFVVKTFENKSVLAQGFEEMEEIAVSHEQVGSGSSIQCRISESVLEKNRFEELSIIRQLAYIMRIHQSSIYSCKIISSSEFTVEIKKTAMSIFQENYMKYFMYSIGGTRFSIRSIKSITHSLSSSATEFGFTKCTLKKGILTGSKMEQSQIIKWLITMLRCSSEDIIQYKRISEHQFSCAISYKYIERMLAVSRSTLVIHSGQSTFEKIFIDGKTISSKTSFSQYGYVLFRLEEGILSGTLQEGRTMLDILITFLRCSHRDVLQYQFIDEYQFSCFISYKYIEFIRHFFYKLIITTDIGRCGLDGVTVDGTNIEETGESSEEESSGSGDFCAQFFADNADNLETSTLPPLPCPEGWNSVPPYCYLDTTENIDYYSAKDLCASKIPGKSHLVYFKSSQEYDDFKNANLGYETYWLGLTDLIQETEFIWDDGTSLSNFGLPYKQYPWYSTEPDNRTSATNWDYINCDCVRSDKKYAFAWRDDHCTNPRWNTVCQMQDGEYPQNSTGPTPVPIPAQCEAGKVTTKPATTDLPITTDGYCAQFYADSGNDFEASTLPPLPCPEGWNSVPPYCYFDTTINTDYYTAKNICTSEFPGLSHLVFFKSSQEYDDFKGANLGYETYWLGLTDLIKETEFIWDDGTSLVNFGLPYKKYPWYSTEPDNRTSATNWDYINCDCVRSDKKYAFAWRDDHCVKPQWNTVCQMQDGEYPQTSTGSTSEPIPPECLKSTDATEAPTTEQTTETATELTTTTEPCENNIYDILFIVDGSGSIGPRNFIKQQSFVKSVIGNFTIGSQETHVAYMQFSTENELNFNFDQYYDVASINTAIDSIIQYSKLTYLGEALTAANNGALTAAEGRRDGVQGLVFVITDGESNDDPRPGATAMAASGHDVWAIGVGRYVNTDQLGYVASDPSKLMLANSFDELGNIVADLVEGACPAK